MRWYWNKFLSIESSKWNIFLIFFLYVFLPFFLLRANTEKWIMPPSTRRIWIGRIWQSLPFFIIENNLRWFRKLQLAASEVLREWERERMSGMVRIDRRWLWIDPNETKGQKLERNRENFSSKILSVINHNLASKWFITISVSHLDVSAHAISICVSEMPRHKISNSSLGFECRRRFHRLNKKFFSQFFGQSLKYFKPQMAQAKSIRIYWFRQENFHLTSVQRTTFRFFELFNFVWQTEIEWCELKYKRNEI